MKLTTIAVIAVSSLLCFACKKPVDQGYAPSLPNASGASADSTVAATSAPTDPLTAAFAVAFPKGATETLAMNSGGASSSPDDGYTLTFVPKKIVSVGDGLVALISEGANDDACHACEGKLRVTYLKQSADGFAAEDPAVQSDLEGNGFGVAPKWKLVTRNGLPTLRVTTSYGNQGCAATSVTIYLLKSDGVVEDKAASKLGVEKCS